MEISLSTSSQDGLSAGIAQGDLDEDFLIGK